MSTKKIRRIPLGLSKDLHLRDVDVERRNVEYHIQETNRWMDTKQCRYALVHIGGANRSLGSMESNLKAAGITPHEDGRYRAARSAIDKIELKFANSCNVV